MSEDLPIVSVVAVNFRGAADTITCLQSFSDVDWPADRLELIVVDNDSGDSSEERIRAAAPHAKIFQSGANLGFAGGCNFGVDRATGEFVGFINNDARPDRGWIRSAIEAFADPVVGAVASKVLDWDGKMVDYVDGAMTWYGMGYKREVELPDRGAWDEPRDVLFGTGAAMFVRRDLYQELGGFDERFFMFYEDVDFGWRLNLLGYTVKYVPGSLAFHRHHVTMKKFGDFREIYLLERNALLSLYKNLGDELLGTALGPAMLLSLSRANSRAALPKPVNGTVDVPKMTLTGPYALDYLRAQLPSLAESRRELQAARTRSDGDLLPLFRAPIEPAYNLPSYLATHEALVDLFHTAEAFKRRARVLVVTGEMLSERMAGPAIRAWEMAGALSATHEVRLGSTLPPKADSDDFLVVDLTEHSEMLSNTLWADVIVFQGFLLEGAPWLVNSSKLIVADVYDPMHLELLEQAKDDGPLVRRQKISEVTDVLNRQLLRADLVLCASDKQRQFWLGQLASQGRINVATSAAGLDQFIRVVPFGLDNSEPNPVRHGIRGTIPGIGMDDKVILWGGGVYNWFDPLTLIRAVGRLAERHPDVRLVFMGMKHPNPGVPEMRVAFQAQELAAALGLTGKHVFFNREWVPYKERDTFLMDADVGVSTHFEHVETAYSFRTRILDYLWAQLPIVATTGDSFGNVLTSEGIGIGVPPEDIAALEQALDKVLYTPGVTEAMREKVRAYAQQFRWNRVLQPLIDFCGNPQPAPDRALKTGGDNIIVYTQPPPGVWELIRFAHKTGGLSMVAKRTVGRLRRLHGAARQRKP